MSGPDAQTLALYDARAADYAQAVKAARPGRLLRAFIADLPPGGAVLDLGCGPGTDAAHMARAGLAVSAIDAAPGMVALAAQVPGVTALVQDFDGFTATAPGAAYDGIWANFSLLHAPRADMPRHLAALSHALRPGGRLHIAVKTGTGSGRDSLGRLYTYYTAEDLTDLLRAAGFDVTGQDTGTETGFDGTRAPWVALAARRLHMPPPGG